MTFNFPIPYVINLSGKRLAQRALCCQVCPIRARGKDGEKMLWCGCYAEAPVGLREILKHIVLVALYISLFFKKANPEPDFRYFSKLTA